MNVAAGMPVTGVAPGDSGAVTDDLRTAVTISRTHPTDVGQRQVIVRLDDGPAAKLVFGDEMTIELQPGWHKLFVHNTLFWKTTRFAIEPGEHIEFIVINTARWWTAGMVGVLGSAPLFLRVVQRSVQ